MVTILSLNLKKLTGRHLQPIPSITVSTGFLISTYNSKLGFFMVPFTGEDFNVDLGQWKINPFTSGGIILKIGEENSCVCFNPKNH